MQWKQFIEWKQDTQSVGIANPSLNWASHSSAPACVHVLLCFKCCPLWTDMSDVWNPDNWGHHWIFCNFCNFKKKKQAKLSRAGKIEPIKTYAIGNRFNRLQMVLIQKLSPSPLKDQNQNFYMVKDVSLLVANYIANTKAREKPKPGLLVL